MDTSPRPRILFQDAPGDIFAELVQLAPTSVRIAVGEDFHPSDWDLVVAFGATVPGMNSFHVLSFGGNSVDGRFTKDNETYKLAKNERTKARSTYVSDECPPELRALAQRTLVDFREATVGSDRIMWEGKKANAMGNLGEWNIKNLISATTPIVQVGDEGYVQSFVATRRNWAGTQLAHVWVLPWPNPDPKEWLREMLEYLHRVEPERFPGAPEWQLDEDWAPPSFTRALQQRSRLGEERAASIAAIDLRLADAYTLIEAERLAAASGAQRLLSEDGDELVAAVISALTDLGFDAKAMDDHHDAKTGAKLEDLRISDPTVPGWVALAEVKGYTKGAKVSEVARIAGRPATAFAIEAGRAPDAVWHIINHWRNLPPSQRPKAIGNDDVDLQPLRDAEGCLIDSRDLFRAWKAVAGDEAGADDVRASMRKALGRWSYATDGSSSEPTSA